MARLIFVEDNSELAAVLEVTAADLGHRVRVASTGKDALTLIDEEAFDFAVVDLLLPDMRGTQVLEKLRDRRIPAVAVSGVYKNDRFARDSVSVYGARKFLEKPFDIARLFRFIADEIGEKTPPRGTQLPALAVGPSELELTTKFDLTSELAELVADDADLLPDEDPSEHVLELLDAVEDDDDEPSTLPPTPVPPPPVPDARAPDGDLTTTSVAKLLSGYHRAKATGTLELKKDAAVKRLFLSKGGLVSAVSNVAAERLGRYCIQKGLFTEAALSEKGLTVATVTMAQLTSSGLLSQTQAASIASEQAQAITRSAFGWSSGAYTFTPRPEEKNGPKRIFLGKLILDGVLQNETLVSVRKKVPAERKLFPIADPTFELHELALPADQARLLISADGTKTVEDLLQLSDLNERDTLATLYAFEQMGLVEERKEAPRSRRESFGL